jgi:hypothetical protein
MRFFSNKYSATCTNCKIRVPVGKGHVKKDMTGKVHSYCPECKRDSETIEFHGSKITPTDTRYGSHRLKSLEAAEAKYNARKNANVGKMLESTMADVLIRETLK